MNPIENLQAFVEASFPTIRCELEPAETPTGSSFLDVFYGSYHINVEWRPERGFALIGGRKIIYGEGSDESFPDLASTMCRVAWLLEHRAKTSPPTDTAVISRLPTNIPTVTPLNS